MRAFTPAILVLLLGSGLAAPAAVSADAFHYQTLPLGQRALGMGGAFTGVANDPSAAYYNPAGVALTPDSALSASLTINAFDRTTVERGYRTRIGDTSLRHDSQPNLPVFVTLVKKVGRKDKEGKRSHGVALSTFTVSQREQTFDVEQRGQVQGIPRADTFAVSRADSTTWNGLSYAYRISPSFSLGLSAFLSVTRTRYEQDHTAVTLGELDMSDGSYESRGSLWETYRARSQVRNLLARIGALYQVDSKTRVGVMFQPPSIHVQGRSDVRSRVLTSDNINMPPSGMFTNASESNLTSHSPIPWELRLGGSYEPLNWVTVAFDTSLYGRSGNKQQPVVAIGPRTADPETGAVAQAGDLALETWYRVMTANVSMGAEAVIQNTLALRAGLFTSLSAAPDVPRVSDVYVPPDVNLFGGALSAGYVANAYDLSLGITGLFGIGDALAYSPDATASEDAYHRTGVTDRMLFVFLSGAKSAVGRLASTADKKMQELRREREAEAAREEREAAREAARRRRKADPRP